MICEKCGSYMPDGSILCDKCGSLLNRKGASGRKQGQAGENRVVLEGSSRPVQKTYDDLDPAARDANTPILRTASAGDGADRPQNRRGPARSSSRTTRQLQVHNAVTYTKRPSQVPWSIIIICLTLVAVVAVAGAYVYLTRTLPGQVMLIKAGRTVSSAQAYWAAGESYMDNGFMEKAIENFEIGWTMDKEVDETAVNVDNLLLLANAYEANAMDDKAEEVYIQLYTTLCPSRSEPYTNLIRMYQQEGREPEAAEIMLAAYTNTGLISFRQMREQYIPNVPTADLTGQTYDSDQVVHLTSKQGYDIYYTLDGTDPKEFGVLYEGEIKLTEGSYSLRAVCLSGNLYSDLYSVSYVVSLPSPAAPRANLAPDTYKRDRSVNIRFGDKDTSVTIYYTIDGSIPTLESPVYNGDAIKLPHGNVTLQAIAVNSYGKQSTVMSYTYKIDLSPYMKKKYSGQYDTDYFADFTLMKTTRDQFIALYGNPDSETDNAEFKMSGTLTELTYSWGKATFQLTSNTWLLVNVVCNRDLCQGPRGLSIGMSESEVVALFRDHGQIENPGGGRGLYTDSNDVGKIVRNEDGSSLITYVYETSDGSVWHLEILLVEDRAVQISHYYSY